MDWSSVDLEDLGRGGPYRAVNRHMRDGDDYTREDKVFILVCCNVRLFSDSRFFHWSSVGSHWGCCGLHHCPLCDDRSLFVAQLQRYACINYTVLKSLV